MRVRLEPILQPATGSTLGALEKVFHDETLKTMDVAVAYITSTGLAALIERGQTVLGHRWPHVAKRWITSFDYCRTEPMALEIIEAMPSSSLHIYDAEFCLSRAGRPRRPFHPKALIFSSGTRKYLTLGSGNLSRSGMTRGVEAGLSLSVAHGSSTESSSRRSIDDAQTWFDTMWDQTHALDDDTREAYRVLYDSSANLKDPTPTEDDVSDTENYRRSLSAKQLQKLRMCRNLWINAGNVTKNRGEKLPGNQLMMKRLTRCFFGFPIEEVAENTSIGSVRINFGDYEGEHSLTFSDNRMDKLTLPIPGNGGPPEYDNKTLLFRKEQVGNFSLSLGSNREITMWKRRSDAIEGAFRMSQGREWGVF